MLKPLLEYLLVHYGASPGVFWAALSTAAILVASWLLILGLCHLSGEADDRADQILAQLERRQAQ
jgi:hypothetical protein